MPYDPLQEDCLRLLLEVSLTDQGLLSHIDKIAEQVSAAYAQNPDQLIHTDRARSFHLVATATELLDYQLTVMSDTNEIDRLEQQAESMLQEAVALDPSNWDACRMLHMMQAASNSEYLTYLLENRDQVEQHHVVLPSGTQDVRERLFVQDLACRPFVRWLSALASTAIIGGRYRLALNTVEEILTRYPKDPSDIRHLGIIALAKLEATRDELHAFRSRFARAFKTSQSPSQSRSLSDRPVDPWFTLAEMSVAWRNFDFIEAGRLLNKLISSYPFAHQALFYQIELPEGTFGRLRVEPNSQDELILAISECTPLLQEGMGAPDGASFAGWIASHPFVKAGLNKQELRLLAAQTTYNGESNAQ